VSTVDPPPAATGRLFWRAFGPGVLFAGAAIGNSHLVQSTRAGAMYGLGLVAVVVVANLMKYPAFRFGPYYAAVTGRSLIEAYRSLGRPVVALVALSELASQAIIIAASALTTAAIALAVFDSAVDVRHLAATLIVLGAALLLVGGYALLDRLTKVFVAVLTVSTLAATVAVLPLVQWRLAPTPLSASDFTTLAFVIALMGFMPSALNLSILHSLWSVAKARTSGVRPSPAQVLLDLNIGYVGSALLALCFLLMGAGVMHTAGVAPASGAGPFARQVIALYTQSLGPWSGALVGVAALTVMFTTLMTVLDGMPRMQAAAITTLLEPDGRVKRRLDGTPLFVAMLVLLSGAAILVLLLFMRRFTDFIDFVTTVAFLVAPLFAILNHVVMFRAEVPPALRPGAFMRLWSLAGIVFLSGVTLVYFLARAAHVSA